MNPNTTQMQDKELLGDVLASQRLITSTYNNYANECATKCIRDDLLGILQEEHQIQAELFTEMHSRGWYPTQPAEQQKIMETKQKFQSVTG